MSAGPAQLKQLPSGAKPLRMLRDRDDAASEHQHADGPDEERKVSIVSHANRRSNQRAKSTRWRSGPLKSCSVRAYADGPEVDGRGAKAEPRLYRE
jgi:hypothetical protein